MTVSQSTDALSLYVDGIKQSEQSIAADFSLLHNAASSFSALIGTSNWAKYTTQFVGEMDEFRIYNSALSANQVKAVYDGYLSGAGQPEQPTPDPDPDTPVDKQIVASSIAKNGTKGYLMVDGKPFTLLGVQTFGEWQIYGNQLNKCPESECPLPTGWSKPLDGLSRDWLENVFEKAAATGIKTLQIELSWKQIQPEKEGEYDFSLIDKYVAWAAKYGLKIDWTWFGSNGRGGGVIMGQKRGYIATMPTYLTDAKYYMKNKDGSIQKVSDDERWTPLIPLAGQENTEDYKNATYLHQQEAAAVHALFNHLAKVDTAHSSILFQVYNEPDSAPYMSSGGAQTEAWLKLADQMGKAVKTADYVVATRMNVKRGNWTSAAKRKVFKRFNDLENIDFIGPDTYDSNPTSQASYVKQAAEISDLGYLPEPGGSHPEMPATLASVLAAGGFMDIWHLNDSWATGFTKDDGVRSGHSMYGDSTRVPNFQSYTTWTLGTIPDMPNHTKRFKNFVTGMYKMNSLVASSESSNMAAFNAASQKIASNANETKVLGSNEVTFKTTTQDVGLAVYEPSSKATYLISDTFGDVTYNLGENKVAEVGEFDADGNWASASSREVADNGDITVKQGELVRVTGESDGGVLLTVLRNAVNNADSITDSMLYTEDSWKAFDAARTKAKAVLANANATQEEVNAAAESLIAAQNALAKKGGEDITLNQLEEALNDAKQETESQYTPESWKPDPNPGAGTTKPGDNAGHQNNGGNSSNGSGQSAVNTVDGASDKVLAYSGSTVLVGVLLTAILLVLGLAARSGRPMRKRHRH